MKKKPPLKPPKKKLKGVQLPLYKDMTPTQKAMIKGEQESVRREKERTDARVILGENGSAYFKQGDLSFPVDGKDLNNVVGANGGHCIIDSLMDSQIISLASVNLLPTKPYVRGLLRPVLTGIVQLAWYRDIENHESDHLYQNQMARVALYLRNLSEYKEDMPADRPTSARASRQPSQKEDKWGKSYQIVAGKRAAASLSGRELQVFNVVAGLKKASTLAQIVEASKGQVDTKQDLTKIVIRFIGKLVTAGAIQEVR